MSKRGTTEAEKLLDAIGQLPEDMLEQALEKTRRRQGLTADREGTDGRLSAGLPLRQYYVWSFWGNTTGILCGSSKVLKNQVYYRAIPGVQRISRRIRRTRQSRYGL